jgi:hypothetical protein
VPLNHFCGITHLFAQRVNRFTVASFASGYNCRCVCAIDCRVAAAFLSERLAELVLDGFRGTALDLAVLTIGFAGIFCIIGGSVGCVADLSLLFETGILGCIFCCGLAGGFAGLKGGAGGELAFGDEPTTRLPRAPPTAVRSASSFACRLIAAHTLSLISFHRAICSCALAISKSLILALPVACIYADGDEGKFNKQRNALDRRPSEMLELKE